MPVIERYLTEDVFKEFEIDLKLIHKIIRKKNAKPNGEFWDMQFRCKNTITLYYKSCAFNFELTKDKNNRYKYKLVVSDGKKNKEGYSLKTYLIEECNKDTKLANHEKELLINNLNKGGVFKENDEISNYFVKFRDVFERAVNRSSYGPNEKNIERKAQQYIATTLENDKRCAVLDYEIAVKNPEDAVSRVTLCRNHGKHKAGESKNFKETDLLILKETPEGRYKFIPIELKFFKNSECGLCQITTYANIIEYYISDFQNNYTKIIGEKIKIGILDEKFNNIKVSNIEPLVNDVVIGIIFNNKISNLEAQRECMKIGLKSIKKTGYLKEKKLKILPIIFGENDKDNKESVDNFIEKLLTNYS